MRKFDFEYLAGRHVVNFILGESVDAATYKKIYDAWSDEQDFEEIEVAEYFKNLEPADLFSVYIELKEMLRDYGADLLKLRKIEKKKYRSFYPALRAAEKKWVDNKLDA